MANHPVTIDAPSGLPFIDVVREFDAPPAAVYRAYTDPELVVQWLGPRQYDTELLRFDARDGGSWAFVQRDAQGNEYRFRGVFHSTVPGERIVQTFEFEGAPGQVNLESTTFEAVDGRTRLVTHTAFQSVEARDQMIANGMEHGVIDSMTRLEELLDRSAQPA